MISTKKIPLEILIKNKVKQNVLVKKLIFFLKNQKLLWLEEVSLYDFLHSYIVGLLNGKLNIRAGAIAFSFFMALFPFALFILNLIPFIPIEGFQEDFLRFVEQSVPPNTYDAIAGIINDILNNSHSGLLSTGFLLSIFLMANGLSAILGGFEESKHVTEKRGVFDQYVVALGMSLFLSFLLLFTVAIIVVFEVFIQQTKIQDVLSDNIPLIQLGRYIFLSLMILFTTCVLLRFGIKQRHKPKFISIGAVFTTILIIISSYGFGIWVVKFSKYNELYGSIGTLLIMMFYIWINCMLLLLGFELNAIIQSHRKQINS
ncbi:ribonuclease BN [Flavobacterium sp. LM5]|jgi:membrane protein|uniref:YihY/virulence factor BrkB family protein n=1 Tax=Flavobacterium sp. LM5 TaxID=1938610 RepID=UPI000994597F|nr:YihY/virulence factor BrkB family protein [Flavobacterium sp. LM5]OOV26343.1 ribonuclease BN [Flavobacterium sp. LM5]